MVETWAEVLDGEVPENELESAYLRALRDKKDSFPLTASDIVKGYRDNCESERSAPRPQNLNQLNGDICGRCYGTGWELVEDPGDPKYKIARRCSH